MDFFKASINYKIQGMPKYTAILFYLIFYLFSSLQCFSQAEQGVRSKNKIILEGHIYYIHIVKQGETLASICITYSTTAKIITDENPEALENIHEGQVLKIPESKVVVETPKFVQTDSVKVHIVQQGQTIYSISRLYGLTPDELIRANPEVKYSSIQVNQVLRIPKSTATDSIKLQSVLYGNFIMHKVEPKQTLFSLARLYKVSMDDIKQANLIDGEWKGLKIGDVIRIPNQQAALVKTELNTARVENQVIPQDTMKVVNKNIPQDTIKIVKVVKPACNCDSISAIPHPGPFNVAMVLPFGLDQIELEAQMDTMQTEGEEDMRQQEALQASAFKRSSGWVEFYQGAMLSLSNLKVQNISVNLFIYDSESDQPKFNNTIYELEKISPEVIIAAADSARILQLSDVAKSRNISLVLPVCADRQIIEKNSNSMAFEPGDEVELDNMVELLKKHKGKNLVIIYTPDSINQRLGNLLFSKIQNQLKFDTSIVHLIQFSEKKGNFVTAALHDSIENLIIVLSKKEGTAGDILRNINNLTIDHQLSVIGLHDWSKFTTIDIAYLHHLQVQYYTPFYYLPTEAHFKSYIKEFIKINQYYPSKTSSAGYNYGILGFDIMNYTITALNRYDINFINCLSRHQPTSYLGPFNFVKLGPEGGWENQNEILVTYTKDYNVIKEPASILKSNN
jgi:LysM repeat protein